MTHKVVLELDILKISIIGHEGISAEMAEGQTDFMAYYRVRGVREGENLDFGIANVTPKTDLPNLHVETTGFQNNEPFNLRQMEKVARQAIAASDEYSVSIHVWPFSDEKEPDMSPSTDKDRIVVISFDLE